MEKIFFIIKAFSPYIAAFFIVLWVFNSGMPYILKQIIGYGMIVLCIVYIFHPRRPHDEE